MIPASSIQSIYGKYTAAIVLCCQTALHKTDVSVCEKYIISQNINITRLLQIAYGYGVSTLVGKILQQTSLALSNAAATTSIVNASIENKLKTKNSVNRYKLLADAGVNVYLYKGACFSQLFYGDIDWRNSSDTDLVIDEKDVLLAKKIFEAEGFFTEANAYLAYNSTSKFIRNEKGISFFKFHSNNAIEAVECHWRPLSNYVALYANNNVFNTNNSQTVSMLGMRVKTLSNIEHIRVVFIHHAISDGFSSLKNFVDICMAFKMLELNEPQAIPPLINNLNKYGFRQFAIAAQQLLGFTLKDVVIEKIDEDICTLTHNCLVKYMQNDKGEITFNLTKSNLNRLNKTSQLYTSAFDKFRCKLKYIKHFFIPDIVDYNLIKFPKFLNLIYSIYRPYRRIFCAKLTNKSYFDYLAGKYGSLKS